ncbi:MAG: glycosyltransferase family 2 protein [Candidatus Rokubacteria bacterium]|nr:glycosyltransferase family 2 protein [Candidatus Rokubacteria bacterium]
MTVGVVIPALNEEATIDAVVAAVPRRVTDEIVVVDNGSSDRTAQVAGGAGAKVVREERRGYGAACARGLASLSQAVEVVVFLDGDGSQDPREMEVLLTPIERGEADLVLGIRQRGAAAHPIHARVGNWVVTTLLRWRYGLRLSDIPPFRAIRRSLLAELRMREMTYGWPVEMVVRVARRGRRIVEVPVTHRPRLGGQSKVAGTFWGSLKAGCAFLTVALRAQD